MTLGIMRRYRDQGHTRSKSRFTYIIKLSLRNQPRRFVGRAVLETFRGGAEPALIDRKAPSNFLSALQSFASQDTQKFEDFIVLDKS